MPLRWSQKAKNALHRLLCALRLVPERELERYPIFPQILPEGTAARLIDEVRGDR